MHRKADSAVGNGCFRDVIGRRGGQTETSVHSYDEKFEICGTTVDIYGDGVNVAARLQELAEPGAIVISDIARRSIDSKLAAAFNYFGPQKLKNIAEPLVAYGWAMSAAQAKSEIDALALPDKPSIAVLPFDNLSGDPDQEYFADGMTEDIITELSRYPEFFVIARNSSFAYKGQSIGMEEVADELGVRFVLGGSVRRAGNRIRVTAQLVDATTGNRVWAERYDRDLDDIFVVQDEITRVIAGTLGPRIQARDTERAMRRDPSNMDAYDHVLRAAAHNLRLDQAGHAEARREAQCAIDIDPTYARAYSVLAFAYFQERNSGYAADPDEWLRRADEAARTAVMLDETDAEAHGVFGIVLLFARRHDQAIVELRRAIELNPNLSRAHAELGNALTFAGRPVEGLEALRTAMALAPSCLSTTCPAIPIQ